MAPYTYDYPRPCVTVDVLLFCTTGENLEILLIERRNPPFQGCWALPGGFVEMEESLEASARRELFEETGLEPLEIEQIGAFGDPDRDPRGRVITIAYGCLTREKGQPPQAGDDAARAQWFLLSDLPDLAFDHEAIIRCGFEKLRGRLKIGS
jgi:8-oxo-dGTP diphosphatase